MQPAIPEDVVQDVARRLIEAERPLLLAGRNGRDPQSLAPLGELADLLGAPIVDSFDYANVAADHPLRLVAGPSNHVFVGQSMVEADVLLFIDTDLLYLPSQTQLASGATVIHLERDPIKEDHVFWNYPIDIRLTAAPAIGLRQLAAAVDGQLTPAQRERARERREGIAAEVRREKEARCSARGARARCSRWMASGLLTR